MADAPLALPGRQPWSVSGLLLAVGDALAARFPVVLVRGELSGFTRAASGHCYFGLKDEQGGQGMLRCVLFRRGAAMLDFAPADGQLVDIRGRLTLYEPRGELQLVVESVQRGGEGALYEQWLRAKARMEALGLFDPSRKRTIDPYPRCLGVITSLAAAALHDVLTTLKRRSPHVRVIVFPSAVQGSDAPVALCEALAEAGRHGDIQTLILCRGGGALEDLAAFNDERLVRQVAASPIPVICGVGHETDVTLCDLAADLRAATPTAAAELAAPPAADCLAALGALAARLRRRAGSRLEQQAQRLDAAALRLARPTDAVRRHDLALQQLGQRMARIRGQTLMNQNVRLARAGARLVSAARRTTERHAQRLTMQEGRLQALAPSHVLARGYAWLSDAQGRVLNSVHRVTPGMPVVARLVDGSVSMQVDAVEPDPG